MEQKFHPQREKRPYHSLIRQRQAIETRQRILDAAHTLLINKGYARMTLEEIAEAAGVSPKTVSAVVGSKTTILVELVNELVNPEKFDSHIQGLLDQLRIVQEPRQRLELVVHVTRQIYTSLASEFELLRTAGGVVPELAELAQQIEARRRQRQTYLIANLCDQKVLCDTLSLTEGTDVLWSLTSYDIYRMLVVQQGWDASRYENWLTNLLIKQLLQPING